MPYANTHCVEFLLFLAGDHTTGSCTAQTTWIESVLNNLSRPKEANMYIGGGFLVLLIILFLIFR